MTNSFQHHVKKIGDLSLTFLRSILIVDINCVMEELVDLYIDSLKKVFVIFAVIKFTCQFILNVKAGKQRYKNPVTVGDIKELFCFGRTDSERSIF